MFDALLISSIYVLDQDKALDFYIGKLGLEVNTDQDLGFMRWLTVSVPGDSRQILTEEPTERPYGIDCGLRDPFGNHIRFSQPVQVPAQAASATKVNR